MTKQCQGPDPDTKAPRTPPPPLSCDTHAHVFGPAARYPFAEGRGYTPPDCPVETYARMLDTLGIERAVIVQGGAHGTDNRVTLDAIASMGERCRGVAVLEPTVIERELETLAAGGFRGLRLSTVLKGGVGTEHLEVMAARARDLGWHVQLHLEAAEELVDLAPRLRRLAVPFVIDHLGRARGGGGTGQPGFQALLGLLKETDGCWVKIASWYRLSDRGSPYADMRPLAEALIEARPDRILWGSNWPHPIFPGAMPNDGDLLDQFLQWAGDEATAKTILVDNPARLYGF